ncbi:MAG: prolyl aminopeptidase [Alphaproteobacteria bacterium]|nr:prolyl aminopeptidase [Alphaproteobacteria bacterium]
MTSPITKPEKIRPFDAIMLDVGDGHWLYVEEVGRKGGVPALFLHGGPGSGSQHAHRALFDSQNNHAILFDQRGSGRSHPYLARNANTLAHQIADIERIREFYGIEKWIVTGGSWGSTLALAYAQSHPERVSALALRAIFLGTKSEVDWAFIDGPKKFRPELYRAFVSALPEAERSDPLAAYLKRLHSPDPNIHTPAANVWNQYERALSVLEPGQLKLPDLRDAPARLPPTPIMEAHYIANDFFLEQDQLVANVHKLKGIPGIIVQGRYDLLCPPTAADSICQGWTDCELKIIDRAGHAISEAGVMEELQTALAKFTAKLR